MNDQANMTPEEAAHHYLETHVDVIREALERCRDLTAPKSVDSDERGYWEHEINALNVAIASAERRTGEQRLRRMMHSKKFDHFDLTISNFPVRPMYMLSAVMVSSRRALTGVGDSLTQALDMLEGHARSVGVDIS